MSPARSRTVVALAALLILTLGGGVPVRGAEAEGAGIASTLLMADDLPADLVPSGVTDEPAFDYDQASFDASGGIGKAAQTWQASEILPDSPVVIVFDFRFSFPSAEAAQEYLDAAEPTLSESVTGITLQSDATPVGDVLRHYAGSLSQGDITIDVQNFLFRIGPVVAKVYISGFGTTVDDSLPIVQAAAARIDTWLAEQPIASPAASIAPAASSPAAVASDAPAVGTDVPYVDAEGIARGLLTLTEVADPFTGFREDRPPDEGTRYVVVSMAFEAADDQTFEADPSDILVQDSQGFLWGRTSVPRPDDATIPELSSQDMAPGNRLSGVIGYVVPEGAQLERVLYQPEGGRLITLAQLAASDAPVVGTDVPYVDAEGVARGLVTVREVADPFIEYREDNPPDEDTRYVMLDIAFEAAEDQAFAADPSDILVQDSEGFLWGRASVTRPPEATIPELSSQDMAPGNRISGVIGYVVPADAQLERVLYQPESGRLITLAQLAPAEGD